VLLIKLVKVSASQNSDRFSPLALWQIWTLKLEVADLFDSFHVLVLIRLIAFVGLRLEVGLRRSRDFGSS
jgi:hypothetical protein